MASAETHAHEPWTMTIPEFARRLGVSKATVYELINGGRFPDLELVTLGQQRRILTESAYPALKSRAEKATDAPSVAS